MALPTLAQMQSLSDLKVPVFWAEGQPEIPPEGILIAIGGLVGHPVTLKPADVRELAVDEVDCRLTWSVRAIWRGILMGRIVEMVRPSPEARFVRLTSFGGAYSTTVGIADLGHPRAVFAIAANGEDLTIAYGGPMRAVFPQLWGYKSAKSLVAVDFLPAYESGYWETRGYEGDAHIPATKLHDLNTRTTRLHPGGEVTW
jgi:DMSO/TMAO reductase YedYZ molybdopterin-dependent catalytic subunit